MERTMRKTDILFLAALFGQLSACGGGTDGGNEGASPAARLLSGAGLSGKGEVAANGFPVSCRLSGQADFADGCTLEWLADTTGGEREFVIRHEDGGFRRFLLSGDGRRVNVGAGAEPLEAEGPSNGLIELRVGGDAYRVSAARLRQR